MLVFVSSVIDVKLLSMLSSLRFELFVFLRSVMLLMSSIRVVVVLVRV